MRARDLAREDVQNAQQILVTLVAVQDQGVTMRHEDYQRLTALLAAAVAKLGGGAGANDDGSYGNPHAFNKPAPTTRLDDLRHLGRDA